jgi:hypothetical protein
MSLLGSCLDVAPMVLFGCRSDGAVWMSLRWCCLDVALMVLFGCRTDGAVWMSLRRSYPIIRVL